MGDENLVFDRFFHSFSSKFFAQVSPLLDLNLSNYFDFKNYQGYHNARKVKFRLFTETKVEKQQFTEKIFFLSECF